MRTIGKNIFVKIDSESENRLSLSTGLELIVMTEGMNNQVETTRKYGVVSHENAVGLPVGTVVYFHHFVVREKNWDQAYKSNAINVDGEKVYLVNSDEDIFAYVDQSGNLIPWGLWTFVEMKDRETTRSGLILVDVNDVININDTGRHLSNVEKENDKGFIRHANQDTLNRLGVSIGDEVTFYSGVNYKIKIDGKEYSRIHAADIVFRA